jgi:hypothetical protein
MITPKFACYFKFERNTSKVKRGGQMVERKTMRFDLSAFAGFWSGFEKLKNTKGDIHFNLISSDQNPNRKTDATTPEYYVQLTPAACKKCFNLSGLRLMFGDEADTWTCSGEPSQKEVLKTGDKNPLYDERNDGFIFVVGKKFDSIELFVLSDGRPFVDAYRKAVALGKYDNELNLMRETASRV